MTGAAAAGFAAIGLLLLSCFPSDAVNVRLKDISRIEGLEETELIGYGVVVGLNGTGDKDIELTKRTMANLLQNFHIALPSKDVKSKNVAAVVVTARAQGFHKSGDRVDVQVASIGDAQSLEGGILLMTPMLDPEGALYALAQGGLTIGGYSAGIAGPGAQTQTKNYTTVGRIPGGASLIEERATGFMDNGVINLLLNKADFTTADRIVEVVNGKYPGCAEAKDAGAIQIRVPDAIVSLGQGTRFVAELESLLVTPDNTSRIVVNERTGTIVMGSNVRVDEAIVAHGNLTVRIGRTLTAYMPAPLSIAKPVVTEQSTAEASEESAKILLLKETSTVNDLADLLNQMGATPRDLISILQALKDLGAIQMDVVTM